MSSSVVTVLSVPAGASLTEVTLIVMRVGRLVEVDAAVGGAAVVLHLEGEARVAGAVGVGRRREHQLAGSDVGDGDELPCRDGDAVVSFRCRRAGSVVIFTAASAVRRAVVRIGEAEVGRGERVRRVLAAS